MAFGIAHVCGPPVYGQHQSHALQMLVQPAVEIVCFFVGSLGLGAVLGVLLTWAAKGAADRDELQGISWQLLP